MKMGTCAVECLYPLTAAARSFLMRISGNPDPITPVMLVSIKKTLKTSNYPFRKH
jgi:hypothetical protein